MTFRWDFGLYVQIRFTHRARKELKLSKLVKVSTFILEWYHWKRSQWYGLWFLHHISPVATHLSLPSRTFYSFVLADLSNLMSFHIPHFLPPSSLTKPISSFSSSSVLLHLLTCLSAFPSSYLWKIHGPYPGKMQWTAWTLWEFRGQGGDDCVFMWDRSETLGAWEWTVVGILMTAPGYTYILISEILNDVTVQWKIM